MKKILIMLLMFGGLFIAGCNPFEPKCDGPFSWEFDLSKCNNWNAYSMEKSVDKNMNTTEMMAFCNRIDPFTRSCYNQESDWTYHMDCNNFSEGYITCNGKMIV